MWTPPQITVEPATNGFVLTATNHGRSAVVGHRIFRAEPWPKIAFTHATEASAQKDAQTLRDYLEDCRTGKRKDSAAKPTKRGWWED